MKSLIKFPSNFPAQCRLLSTPDAQSRRTVLAPGQLPSDRNPYPKAPLSSAAPLSHSHLQRGTGGLLHGTNSHVKLQATSEQGLLGLRLPWCHMSFLKSFVVVFIFGEEQVS